MAISLVGSAVNAVESDAGGDWSVDISGISVAEDDLILVAVATGSTTSTPAVSGYTLIDDEFGNDTRDCRLAWHYLFAGASPPSSVVIANMASGRAMIGVVVVLRGVDTSTPFDVTTPAAVGGADTGRPTPPAITPTTADAWAVCAGAGSSATAFTNNGDFDTFVEESLSATNSAGCGVGLFAWSSGTFTPSQYTGGSGSTADSHVGMTIALRPGITVDALTGNSIDVGSPVIDSAAVLQVQALSGSAIDASAHVLDTPTLVEVIPLTGDGIDGGTPLIDASTLAQLHALTGAAIDVGSPLLDSPALVQAQILTGDAINVGAPVLDEPALALVHALSPDGILAGAPLLDQVVAQLVYSLTGDAITTGSPSLDLAALNPALVATWSVAAVDSPVSWTLAEVAAPISWTLTKIDPPVTVWTLREAA